MAPTATDAIQIVSLMGPTSVAFLLSFHFNDNGFLILHNELQEDGIPFGKERGVEGPRSMITVNLFEI